MDWKNVRKFHLLGSLDEKVKRDLVLSSCGSANDVFRLLGQTKVQGLFPLKETIRGKTIELDSSHGESSS
ncbi:unnamed protein product [Coregonus sp. 'balchen']|nr:unnamed protein product [Coregonus sp. 'balchen']